MSELKQEHRTIEQSIHLTKKYQVRFEVLYRGGKLVISKVLSAPDLEQCINHFLQAEQATIDDHPGRIKFELTEMEQYEPSEGGKRD
jgi:hypothetical protein